MNKTVADLGKKILNDAGMYFLGTTKEMRPYTGSQVFRWCALLEGSLVGTHLTLGGINRYVVVAAVLDIGARMYNVGLYSKSERKQAKVTIAESGMHYGDQSLDNRVLSNLDIGVGFIGYARQGFNYVPSLKAVEVQQRQNK